jgi:hypothetical protein
MKRILTIQAAEGGTDSKLLVADLFNSYIKMFSRYG